MAAISAERKALRTLIVEDEKFTQQAIETVLTTMGVGHVDKAEDGLKGLEKVKAAAQPYDLIISDINMPNMDGLEFVKSIRKDYPKTIIVMLTSRSDTADFNKAKFMGVEYFFMKPITPPMLRIRLSAVLGVAEKNKSA